MSVTEKTARSLGKTQLKSNPLIVRWPITPGGSKDVLLFFKVNADSMASNVVNIPVNDECLEKGRKRHSQPEEGRIHSVWKKMVHVETAWDCIENHVGLCRQDGVFIHMAIHCCLRHGRKSLTSKMNVPDE